MTEINPRDMNPSLSRFEFTTLGTVYERNRQAFRHLSDVIFSHRLIPPSTLEPSVLQFEKWRGKEMQSGEEKLIGLRGIDILERRFINWNYSF